MKKAIHAARSVKQSLPATFHSKRSATSKPAAPCQTPPTTSEPINQRKQMAGTSTQGFKCHG